MRQLVDQGVLRSPYNFGVGTQFVPQLYSQIQQDLQIHQDHSNTISKIVELNMKASSKLHRDAMIKEYKRKAENKKQQILREKEIQEQKR